MPFGHTAAVTHGWTPPGDGPRPAAGPGPAPAPGPVPPDVVWSPPPAGWSPPPAGWSPPPRRTEPWAVVTLVLGAVALVPVAVVTGVVALVRMRRHGTTGLGLVLGGLGAAFVWLGLGSAVTLLVVLGGPGAGTGAPQDVALRSSGSPTQVPAGIGSCLVRPDGSGPWREVPCTREHDGEVMWVGAVAAAREPWPGEAEAVEALDRRCYPAFETYTGVAWDDSPLDYELYAPDEAQWSSGRLDGACVLVDPAGPLPGADPSDLQDLADRPGEVAGAIRSLPASVGSCVVEPGTGEDVWRSVPCTQPHAGEVVWNGPVDVGTPGADHPGVDALVRWVHDACLTAVQGDLIVDRSELDLGYFLPTADDWERLNVDTASCVVRRVDGAPLTAALRPGSR